MMPEPNSTQLRPSSRAKSLACPKCADVAVHSFDHEDGDWSEYPGVTRTEAVCANGHIWSVRWVESID